MSDEQFQPWDLLWAVGIGWSGLWLAHGRLATSVPADRLNLAAVTLFVGLFALRTFAAPKVPRWMGWVCWGLLIVESAVLSFFDPGPALALALGAVILAVARVHLRLSSLMFLPLGAFAFALGDRIQDPAAWIFGAMITSAFVVKESRSALVTSLFMGATWAASWALGLGAWSAAISLACAASARLERPGRAWASQVYLAAHLFLVPISFWILQNLGFGL